MTTATQYTKEEIRNVIKDAFGFNDPEWGDLADHERETVEERHAAFIVQVNLWLHEGAGVAVYNNHDLSSLRSRPLHRFIRVEDNETPPEVPGDSADGNFGWRYRLEGTYRGEAL